jgi:hypothetical protein
MKKTFKYNLTEDDLKTLADFGKEEDGSYCDRWRFIIKNKMGVWRLYFFSEVDDCVWFIKDLRDLNDLKNVYKAITDENLIIK